MQSKENNVKGEVFVNKRIINKRIIIKRLLIILILSITGVANLVACGSIEYESIKLLLLEQEKELLKSFDVLYVTPYKERTLPKDPSTQARELFYAGDVYIVPFSNIYITIDSYDVKIHTKAFVAYSHRKQEIIIKNMQFIYDDSGVVIPLLNPDKPYILNINNHYIREGNEQNAYYGVEIEDGEYGNIGGMWLGQLSSEDKSRKVCGYYGICVEDKKKFHIKEGATKYRLQYEVEYEEDGEQYTKKFEYHYTFGRKEKVPIYQTLIEMLGIGE